MNCKNVKYLLKDLKGIFFVQGSYLGQEIVTVAKSSNLKRFKKSVPYISGLAACSVFFNNSLGLWHKMKPSQEQIYLNSPPKVVIYNIQVNSHLDEQTENHLKTFQELK